MPALVGVLQEAQELRISQIRNTVSDLTNKRDLEHNLDAELNDARTAFAPATKLKIHTPHKTTTEYALRRHQYMPIASSFFGKV